MVGCKLFGSLLIRDVYQLQGLHQREAERHLSLLFIAANCLCLVSSLFVGWLSDRVRLYKLILVANFGILASGWLMLYAIYIFDEH